MAQNIIARIEKYCRDAGIKENSLGVYIMGDPSLIHRVREGRTLSVTLDRIDAWLKANPANKRRRRGRPKKEKA